MNKTAIDRLTDCLIFLTYQAGIAYCSFHYLGAHGILFSICIMGYLNRRFYEIGKW